VPVLMGDDLRELLAARHGHFLLESGHHGDLWLELDRLVARPATTRPFVAALAGKLAAHEIEAVCGPLTGGAFLAQLVATELGVSFSFTERLVSGGEVRYRVPAALRGDLAGQRIAVVDDAINAGSAVGKTLGDLDACGAVPAAIGALLVLGSAAARLAAGRALPLERIDTMRGNLWTPDVCPQCAAQVPLERPLA
jgi:orotate phosphoribosyltransferase